MEVNSIRLTYPVSLIRFVIKFLLPDIDFTLSEDGRHSYNEKIPYAQWRDNCKKDLILTSVLWIRISSIMFSLRQLQVSYELCIIISKIKGIMVAVSL
jgi:hypothetical protein